MRAFSESLWASPRTLPRRSPDTTTEKGDGEYDAGSEGDGARVRDGALYVESGREEVERRAPLRRVELRSLAEAGG